MHNELSQSPTLLNSLNGRDNHAMSKM